MGKWVLDSNLTDEQIERQRQEAADAYASKILALKQETVLLQEKKDALASDVDEALRSRLEDIAEKEKQVNLRMSEADSKAIEASNMLEYAKSEAAQLASKSKEFEKMVTEKLKKFDVDSVAIRKANEDLTVREENCKQREIDLAHNLKTYEQMDQAQKIKEQELQEADRQLKFKAQSLETARENTEREMLNHIQAVSVADKTRQESDAAKESFSKKQEEADALISEYKEKLSWLSSEKEKFNDGVRQFKVQQIDFENKRKQLNVTEQRIKEELESLQAQKDALNQLLEK